MTDKFSYVLDGVSESVLPNREYAFQAVAREDKGWLGKDWNKSPITYFKTSRSNPTVDVDTDPLPQPQIPTERPTPGSSVGGGQPSPSKNKSTKRPKKRVKESETNEGLNGVLEMG